MNVSSGLLIMLKSSASAVGKENPKDVYILIPSDKRDSTGMIRLRILRWGEYLGLFRWVQFNHMGPL